MFNSKKPLFSKPVLAVVMVLSTLLIWVLNLTAPEPPFSTPHIKTWTTQSGIPVIWLTQDKWQDTNKLTLRIAFHSGSQRPHLNQATLSLLMGDSLPLSTSTINQRLAPLTAKVGSYYDNESQSIGFTLNSDQGYLAPSLELITQWLLAPTFKPRSFEQWNRQANKALSIRDQLEQTLFSQPHKQTAKPSITLEQVRQNYTTMTQKVSAIYLIGNMNQATQDKINASLTTLSTKFSPAKGETDTLGQITQATTPSQITHDSPSETQSMIAFFPLSSVNQWIGLQIWGTDLVNSLNNQTDINYSQLTLLLRAYHPWAYWRVQYADKITADTRATTDPSMTARDFIDPTKVPSVIDKARFQQLLDTLKQQLTQKTLDPSWWSNLAATSTQIDSKLTLSQFAQNYSEALTTFNQDDYKAALKTLLITSSYQEIQVKQ